MRTVQKLALSTPRMLSPKNARALYMYTHTFTFTSAVHMIVGPHGGGLEGRQAHGKLEAHGGCGEKDGHSVREDDSRRDSRTVMRDGRSGEKNREMGHTGWSHGLLVRAHPWRAHVGRGRRWRRAPVVSVTSTQQGHRVPATLVRQRSRDRVACLASVSRTQPVPVTRRQGPSACARPAPVRQGWSTPRCVLDRPTQQIPVVQGQWE